MAKSKEIKKQSDGNKMEKRLHKVELELKEVKLRLDKVELRLNKIEIRLDKVGLELKEVKLRLEKLEIEVTRNTKSIDNLADQIVQNTETIKQMVTGEEFNETTREILDGQDKAMTILKRLDQERVFANTRLDRLEEKVLQ